MSRRLLSAVAGLLFAGCAEAAPPAQEPPRSTAPAQSPCRENILRNPLFGIADPTPPADLTAPVTRESEAGGRLEALWAWRAASPDEPRWTRHQTAAEGPLYLGEGEGVIQSGLKLTPGRWRLTIWAAGASPDAPSGLGGSMVDGSDDLVFEIESGPPTVHVVELDVSTGADQLALTGLGPGEARLMQACLSPIG